jgi:hypothetical protein
LKQLQKEVISDEVDVENTLEEITTGKKILQHHANGMGEDRLLMIS